jgi:membrane-associated protein
MSFIHTLFDPLVIIQTVGLLGIFFIVFAESGLFFGFFLPGDSLLFTAGFLASQGSLPVAPLFIGIIIAAILGDFVGYTFGSKIGPALFSKENSLFFNKKHPERAQRFYETHGKKTIIVARFIPIIRTFAPIVAGIGGMRYQTFIAYNMLGGAAWSILLTGAGFLLGRSVPDAASYMTPIILVIILISFIPGIIHFIKERKHVV